MIIFDCQLSWENVSKQLLLNLLFFFTRLIIRPPLILLFGISINQDENFLLFKICKYFYKDLLLGIYGLIANFRNRKRIPKN